MSHSELYFPYSADNLIHIAPLKLVDSFNDWFDKSNQIIAALNPLNMYDVAADGGLGHSDTFSEIEVNAGPAIRINLTNQVTVDILGLTNAELAIDSDETETSDNIYVAADDYYMLEHVEGGDPTALRKVQAGFMLPKTLYGDHIFAGAITFIDEFVSASTQNFRIEDQQLEIAVPFNEQGDALPQPESNQTDALLGGNVSNRAGIVVLGKTPDTDRQEINFEEASVAGEKYISGQVVVQGANQIFPNAVELADTSSFVPLEASGTAAYFDGTAAGEGGASGSYLEIWPGPSGTNLHLNKAMWQIDFFANADADAVPCSLIEKWGTGPHHSYRLEWGNHHNSTLSATGVYFHFQTALGITGTVTGGVNLADNDAGVLGGAWTGWHHIAVVGLSGAAGSGSHAGRIGVYVDGALGSEKIITSGQNPAGFGAMLATGGDDTTHLLTGNPVLIGGYAIDGHHGTGWSGHMPVSGTNSFKGYMDAVRIRQSDTVNTTLGLGCADGDSVLPATITDFTQKWLYNLSGDTSANLWLPFSQTEATNEIFDNRGVYGTVVKFVTGIDIDDEQTALFNADVNEGHGTGSWQDPSSAVSGQYFQAGESFTQWTTYPIIGTILAEGTVVSHDDTGSPFSLQLQVETGQVTAGDNEVNGYYTTNIIVGGTSGVIGIPSSVSALDVDPLLVIDGVTGWETYLTGNRPVIFSTGGGEILSHGGGPLGRTTGTHWSEIGNANLGAHANDIYRISFGWQENNKEWTWNYGSDGGDTVLLGGAWRTSEHIEFESVQDAIGAGAWPKGIYSKVGDVPIFGGSTTTGSSIRFTNVGDVGKSFRIQYKKTSATTGINAMHFSYMVSGGNLEYPGDRANISGGDTLTGWIMNPDGTHFVPAFNTTGIAFPSYADPPHKRDGVGQFYEDDFRSETHGDSFSRASKPYSVPVADKYGVVNHSWINRQIITSKLHGGDITGHGFLTGQAIRRYRTDSETSPTAREWVLAFASQLTGTDHPGDPNTEDATLNAEALGLVSRVIDAYNFEICYTGAISFTEDEVASFHDSHPAHSGIRHLLPGEAYFVSDREPGFLTEQDPDDFMGNHVGTVRKPMMVATSELTGVVVNYIGGKIPEPATGPDDMPLITGNINWETFNKSPFTQDLASDDYNLDPGAGRRHMFIDDQRKIWLKKIEIRGCQAGNEVVGDISTTAGFRIKSDNIDDAQIISDKIRNRDVTQIKLSRRTDADAGAVDTENLRENAVDEIAIGSNVVSDRTIQDGAILNRHLFVEAIEGTKIEINTMPGDRVTDDSMHGDKISKGQFGLGTIQTNRITNQAITEDKLAENSVSEGKLQSNAVTEHKYADASIPAAAFKGHLDDGEGQIRYKNLDETNFFTDSFAGAVGFLARNGDQLELSTPDGPVDPIQSAIGIVEKAVLGETQKPGVSGGTSITGGVEAFSVGANTRTNHDGLVIRTINKIEHHPSYIHLGPFDLTADLQLKNYNTGSGLSDLTGAVQLTGDQFYLEGGDYHLQIDTPIGAGKNFAHRAVLLAHMPDSSLRYPNEAGYNGTAGDDNDPPTYPSQWIQYIPQGDVEVNGVAGYYPVAFGSNAGPGETSTISSKLHMPNGPNKFFVATQLVKQRTDTDVIGTQTLTLKHDGSPHANYWSSDFLTGPGAYIYQVSGFDGQTDTGIQDHETRAIGRVVEILTTGASAAGGACTVKIDVTSGEFITGGDAGDTSATWNVFTPSMTQINIEDISFEVSNTSGGLDTSSQDVNIRGNWGLPMNSTSDPDALLTGGWITGSYEQYTNIQIEKLVGPEFAASTGGAYGEQNGVCCCVDDSKSIYTGVSREECATMIANWTPDSDGTANLGVDFHHIPADEIVWYDGTNNHTAEGNCYPPSDPHQQGFTLGPLTGAHANINYGYEGGCYVAP